MTRNRQYLDVTLKSNVQKDMIYLFIPLMRLLEWVLMSLSLRKKLSLRLIFQWMMFYVWWDQI